MPVISVAVFVVYYAYQAWVESMSDSSTPASQMTLNTLMRRVRSAWVHKNFNGGSAAVNVSQSSKVAFRITLHLYADVSRLHPFQRFFRLLCFCRELRAFDDNARQLPILL